MREVARISVNIYQPVSFCQTNTYKDGIVDSLLAVRDNAIDFNHDVPTMAMSEATYAWLYRMFYRDTTFIDGVNCPSSFWGMDILRSEDIENGVIAFRVDE